ncbi:type I restriction modification DNA specificity domain protein [Fusobacterium equinum]|uniref:Type I restriction modification DNA specificity domain protein n=1 Tax=Fusobacterium equinum TaxID=134605 RepID=A0A133NGS2_9FUSO|nr:restriction endonuclease subunit S [Fusobacterium equinum]KXA15494.1 type I restriction modification DNA specificity domain protein [Fusobacterium equinum]
MAKKKELTIEEKLQAALVSKEEQPYEIPDSWVWVRLGSVTDFFGGSGFPEQYQGIIDKEIPFYKVKHLKDADDSGYLRKTENYIDEEISKKIKANIFQANTIVFAKIGEAIKLNRRAILSQPSCVDNNLMVMQVKGDFDYRFAYYWTKKEDFYKFIQATTVPSIKQSTLANLIFAFPPIKEQQRIVKKLDFLFEKTKKAKELLQEVKEEVEMRKISILDKAFRGELTKKWREKNKTGSALDLLQEIQNEKMKKWEEECCEAEKNGSKKPKKIKISKLEEMIVPKDEEPYEIPDTWKWVKLGEISQISMGQSPLGEKVNSLIGVGLIGGPSDMGENYPIITRYTSQITKLSSIGDIIVSIRATLGKNIFSDGEYCLGRGVCGIRSKIVNNILLRFYFTNSIEYLYKISSGTTFAQVSKEDISNLYFPLPPLEEQQEIVRVLEEVLEKEKKVKELIDLEEKIDLLEKSILDKAFRGKLGTQDINDEPALELLKKIIDKEE